MSSPNCSSHDLHTRQTFQYLNSPLARHRMPHWIWFLPRQSSFISGPSPTCILQAGHRDLYLQFLISACNSMPVPGPAQCFLLGMPFALFLDISSSLSAHEGSGTQSRDGRHQRHLLVPTTHLPPLLLSKHPCSSLRALRWSRGKGASLGDPCGQAGLVST